MKKIIKFIYIFIIIGLESLGNMSAVASVLQDNLVKKNKYVTDEDIVDAITVARLGPGATTAIAVAYLGNKINGFWGGALATVCYTIAPLFVILILFSFFEKILELQFINSALRGCLVYISVSLINNTIKMGKNILNNYLYKTFFVIVLVTSIIFKISSVWFIIISILFGFFKIYLFDKFLK